MGFMHKRLWIFACLLGFVVAQSACGASQPSQGLGEPKIGDLQILSSAFEAGDPIPERYTCDGADISIPLSWPEPPPGTESLVMIFDDPDAPAGTWVHWVLFDIPASARSLPEDVSAVQVVEGVGVHGANSWGIAAYGGPCPPQGSTHGYVFRLYALDTLLDLNPGASRKDVDKAMEGHLLALGELSGTYGR
jgi:Raf kinase inhibitor-like YbhB/YbcL family protein